MVGGGEGDDQLWGSGRGAIARCHSSVLWLGGRVTTNFNFGGMDVVPLLGDDQLWGSGRGAIARCHSSVLWLGGRVTTNFNFGGMDVVPLLGAIAGCHCSVLWWGEGSVTTNFGGVDVVPLQGVIVVCYGGGREGFGGVDVVPLQGANFCFISSSYIQGHQFHADAQENNNEFSFLQTLHCSLH